MPGGFWTEDDAQRAVESAAGDLRAIRQDDFRRQAEDRLHAGLYSGATVAGFTPTTYSRLRMPSERLRWNVCRPVIDTATAKIASKNQVRPMFLTTKGDFSLAERAKRIGRFVDGALYEGKGRQRAMLGFRDCAMFGTGLVKVSPYRDRVSYERVMPANLACDPAGAMNGRPQTLYETRYFDRDALAALYPKKKSSLESVPAVGDGTLAWFASGVMQGRNNLVEVNEAWHLPDEDGKRGRHLIFTGGVSLRDEPWTDESFPFASMYWHEPVQGFWGHGALHDIRDIQREINQTLERAHDALRHAAIPRWHAEKGSGVAIEHLRGGGGAVGDVILRNMGSAMPVIQPGIAMPTEVYNWLREQYVRAFELSGVSTASAMSKLPPGIESGVAQREYHDIETERFATIARGFEEFMMDIARRTVECARRIYKTAGEYTVRAANKRVIEAIDWKDVEIADDAYILQVSPSSILPTTPAGKLDFLANVRNAGAPIDNETFMRLLGFPDTDAEFSLRYAGIDLIDSRIEKMLGDTQYIAPEAWMPLATAIDRTKMAYLRARTDEVPEERLTLLRRFVEDCETLLERSPPPAMMALPNGADLTTPPMAVQTPLAA